ncbi:hypothetical protein V8G54_034092 [Vigna mungo]|uniref:Reverse transcriptase Ty1/copia-type domain-containing protein n=1 Tax=Vigna mungo TaxID=3915 RepID=A0AAQ3MP36_VIGMU
MKDNEVKSNWTQEKMKKGTNEEIQLALSARLPLSATPDPQLSTDFFNLCIVKRLGVNAESVKPALSVVLRLRPVFCNFSQFINRLVRPLEVIFWQKKTVLTITEYITWVEKVANQLGRNGEQMPSSRISYKRFRKYRVHHRRIEDLSVLTVDELAGSLEVREQRRRSWDDKVKPNDQALQVQLLRAKILAAEDEEAEDKDEGDVVEAMKREPVSSIEMTEDKEKAEEMSQKWNVLSVANMTTMDMNVDKGSATIVRKNERNLLTKKEEDEEDMRILLTSKISKSKVENWDVGPCLKSKAKEISTNSVWYLDTGASNHMCGNRSFFDKLTKVEARFVSFGDDSKDKHGRLAAKVKAKKNRLYELQLKILQKRCLNSDNSTDEVNITFLLTGLEDIKFEEVVLDERWKKAMDEEINSIEKNETWELTYLPMGVRPIGVKWVYKKKINAEGEGYKQQKGIDYDEVFAPVTRMETIQLLFSLAAQQGWKIQQMDVKSAFLNGFLEEEVYVEQPLGYMRRDDLIFMGSKTELVEEFKEVMKKEFEVMKEFKPATTRIRNEMDQSTSAATKVMIGEHEYINSLVTEQFTYRRNKNGKTAWEIYELKHLQRGKDCSEALKDLSNSGSVVAVLIAGISFATSTTVPGSTEHRWHCP